MTVCITTWINMEVCITFKSNYCLEHNHYHSRCFLVWVWDFWKISEELQRWKRAMCVNCTPQPSHSIYNCFQRGETLQKCAWSSNEIESLKFEKKGLFLIFNVFLQCLSPCDYLYFSFTRSLLSVNILKYQFCVYYAN